MNFDITAVLVDMLAAMKASVKEDWEEVQGYAKQILENEEVTLKELAKQRIDGLITQEELESELEDEKDTIEAEMKAIQVMTKAAAQKAAQAAMDILSNAIKAAL